LREAEAAFRAAIHFQPEDPAGHAGLGGVLFQLGRYPEAEAACREAIRLAPDHPVAQHNLGLVLSGQGRHAEAEEALREAIRLQPELSDPHNDLGLVLEKQGKPKAAEEEFRTALRLKPDYHRPQYNLGRILYQQERYPEAETAYRAALRLKPDYPQAHCNLGHTLRKQGRFTEALAALRHGDELGRKVPGWSFPSADWVRQCERLVELDRRLPAILRGDAEPASAPERIELANFCQQYVRLPVTAARLGADAFAAEPRLARDLNQQHRYNAACSALRGAAGQGDDAKLLPDRVTLALRRQALGWLRADLALYAQLAERPEAAVRQVVRQRLGHWQQDADLAAVRDKERLGQLPENERENWHKLWLDVSALLQRTEGK
jgi:Flp pilus assembly protein TadD